jgi:hypothetical protein
MNAAQTREVIAEKPTAAKRQFWRFQEFLPEQKNTYGKTWAWCRKK